MEKDLDMKRAKALHAWIVAVGISSVLVSLPSQLSSQQSSGVRIDNDDIGGVVTSAKGPEAGVWVIAETTDLPTKFAKIVVTDGQGRYVLPDLPKANYSVWVRGYGLVLHAQDSGQERISLGEGEKPERVVERGEDQWLHNVPSNG
jgi:hypothetical protein